MLDVKTWPSVPEHHRPKNLYVDVGLREDELLALQSKGWNVVDTRTMPGSTEQDRMETVKAMLEGIRVGSIEVDKSKKDFLDFELYILGIKGKGVQAQDRGDLAKRELDVLLDFKGTKGSASFRERMRELEDEPKDAKSKKSRKAK